MSSIQEVSKVQALQGRGVISPWPLIILAGLALVVRFHGITVPVIWYDESYSLSLSERSPASIWFATAVDVHPPLYYVLLHYWMLLFGNGVAAVRGLSAVADVGALLLSVKLMSLVATQRAAFIAGLLLVLLPISVRYSQEARMYTLLGFWLMAASVSLVSWVRQPHCMRYPVMYVVLMTAAFYTHYFAALCVPVHWLYWSGAGSGRPAALAWRRWLSVNVAIVILYLPWLPHLVGQSVRMKGLEWISPTTWNMLPELVSQFVAMASPPGDRTWVASVILALMIICATQAVRYGRIDRRSALLIVAYFFLPVVTVFVSSWAKPIFVPRYFVFAAVGLPLIVALALDGLAMRRPVLASICLSVFIAGEVHGLIKVFTQCDGLNGTYERNMIRPDILADGIKQQLQAGDEIIVDGPFWYLPFSYYNNTGIEPRIYVGRMEVPHVLGGGALIPQRLDWTFSIDDALTSRPRNRVWWVTGEPDPQGPISFPSGWRQILTLKGGDVEALLFVRGNEP
ncbi:glycosyltransferase family 39 protein [Pseudomonas sp. PDM04]|uniref:glycosyltransferase family 39 protein n=1 Tax=Pseudomonas sp. PDM04 TaxID=2769296 RepID=UPI0017831A0C|nr:glycosyltransferase family 39 protein [Pseudomonas sp. PDM04]MBD9440737.1 glycosyltransferase family 39 protein [Pseudomonas sp. PDM04]